MNKFQFISLIIHVCILFLFYNYIKSDSSEKFVQKMNMEVGVVNRKAKSSNSQVYKEKASLEESDKFEKKEEIVQEKKEETSLKKIFNKKKMENKKQIKKSKREEYNEFQDKNRFIQGIDGIFTAIKSDGIDFEILKEVDPNYPIIAKKMGYSGEGKVSVKFLVDLNGELKNIKVIGGEKNYGFKEEVIKALKKWKFKPIIYKGKRIRANFEKTFIFNNK